MLQGVWPIPSCQRCTNWESVLQGNQSLLTPAPSGYPESLGVRQIEAVKLSFDYLKGAVETAHDSIVNDTMTEGEAEVSFMLPRFGFDL